MMGDFPKPSKEDVVQYEKQARTALYVSGYVALALWLSPYALAYLRK